MAKTGNSKLGFMAKSIRINFFGLNTFIDVIDQRYQNLKTPFDHMDTLTNEQQVTSARTCHLLSIAIFLDTKQSCKISSFHSRRLCCSWQAIYSSVEFSQLPFVAATQEIN